MSAQPDKKILFVDDEENVLKAIKRQFHRQFKVETALGGEQGLEVIANSGPFAVVVSDLHMNGMNGLDFLKLVTATQPKAVNILITSYRDEYMFSDAVRMGVTEFIDKTFYVKALVGLMGLSLRRQTQKQANRLGSYKAGKL